MTAKSIYYLDKSKAGREIVRSHRDPSWSCVVELFLSDKFGAYSDTAKSAIRKQISKSI
jgi:hypothetical protein